MVLTFPKERLEIFGSGKIILLDNFKKLKAWGVPGFKNKNLFKQNKGQYNCIKAFLDAIKNSSNSPIPIDELFEIQKILLDSI